ncbi:demethylmenaquinone methyltransferase, partial [Elysia marginata]
KKQGANSRILETNAVKLCKIKPDHKVLEIGFGSGIGLQAAYNVVKDGKGVVYGVDPSLHMVSSVSKKMRKAVRDKKVFLFHSTADQIPLNTDSVQRVFHSDCYYFWPLMRPAMREIFRVMQPGGVMITLMNLQHLQQFQKAGYLKYATVDPVKYMTCLENYGFSNVRLEYHKDDSTGKEFQAIFSEVVEKPAHDPSMLSDDEDEMEREVKKLLDEKEDYRHLTRARHK